jgi:hypothetical protein
MPERAWLRGSVLNNNEGGTAMHWGLSFESCFEEESVNVDHPSGEIEGLRRAAVAIAVLGDCDPVKRVQLMGVMLGYLSMLDFPDEYSPKTRARILSTLQELLPCQWLSETIRSNVSDLINAYMPLDN